MLISDNMSTSSLDSSMHEQNNENGYDSLQNTQYSIYDSVSGYQTAHLGTTYLSGYAILYGTGGLG